MCPSVIHTPSPVATDFGDVKAEFRSLVSSAGVLDLSSRAKIVLTGSDRVRWLNGMVTNNIRDLAVGHGVYAFLLNPQGHILADLYAYNRGESLLLDTDQQQLEKLLATFDHYIIMDDVEVADISDKIAAVGLTGPKAQETIRKAGIEIPELAPLQFVELTSQGMTFTVVRGDNPAVDAFEFWATPEHAGSIRERLEKAGARSVGTSALELLRIAAGLPRYGHDIRERDLPQETEQTRALHFSKGCYIGQEIVERIRSRGGVHRKFTGFEITGPLPAVGTTIQAEGRDVGEITSAVALPMENGELKAALGYIRREVIAQGKQLQAGDAQLIARDLPFASVFPARQS